VYTSKWQFKSREKIKGCAGSFVADVQQKPHRKYLANCICMSPSTRSPPILLKPGVSQEPATHLLKHPASANAEGQH